MNKKTTIFGIAVLLLLVGINNLSFSGVADEPFTLKWTCYTGFKAYIGPVTEDINGDGIHEIFIAGTNNGGSGGRIMCIDGSKGTIILQKYLPNIEDPHAPMAIGDLDNDGTYEIVHSKSSYGGKKMARNC